jgi:hypothetical protein
MHRNQDLRIKNCVISIIWMLVGVDVFVDRLSNSKTIPACVQVKLKNPEQDQDKRNACVCTG